MEHLNKDIKKSKFLIYLVSVFSITLWGISYIWTDMLIELDIPVFYFVFVRILLAGIILFLLNATRGRITRIQTCPSSFFWHFSSLSFTFFANLTV